MIENDIENEKHCVSIGVELELYYLIMAIDEDDTCNFETKQAKKRQAIKDFIQVYSNVYKKISQEEIKNIVHSKLKKMLCKGNDLDEEEGER